VCGVGQGCPISSYLFCIAINPILEKLSDYYKLIITAYMDDLLIFVPTPDRYEEIIETCRAEFGSIGLEINDHKC
jgi:hypothetical protein